VVRTLDGGASFATIDTKTTRASHELQFVDGMTGFAATMSRDLLKTTDGGDEWQTIPTPASFDDLHFATPFIGLAVAGNGSIYGTVDGGQSWTRQPAGWSNFGQTRAVWMASETDAVVVGSEAKIQYTRTAGGL